MPQVVPPPASSDGGGALAAHVAAEDPHPQYMTETAAVETFVTPAGLASALAGHVAGSDPHPQYLTEASASATYVTQTAAASDYQPLNAGLTTIGGLSPSGPSVLFHSGSAWSAVSEATFALVVAGLGTDGNLSFDGTSTVTVKGRSLVPSGAVYTLTADIDARDLSLASGVRLAADGFMVRAWRCTIAAGATVYISDNGATGSSPAGAVGEPGGGLRSTTGRTTGAGGAGASSGAGVGGTPQVSPSIGGSGGAGGAGGAAAGGAGGPVGWGSRGATGEPVSLPALLTGRGVEGSAWKGGGGGGGGGRATSGGAGTGGGGGAGGGVCIFVTALLDLGAAANLFVEAQGGAGGDASVGAMLAGGGGGGGGGCAVLVAHRRSLGAGASVVVRASGGTGGLGSNGSNATSGSAGRTYDVSIA